MSIPAKGQHPESGGVFLSLPRRRSRRRRLINGTGAALVVIATVAASLAQEPQPGDHDPMPVCSNSAGTSLRADIDADGELDEIRDPYRDGESSTVIFHHGDDRFEVGVEEGRGFWQKVAGMWHEDMETHGTFGDFDGDGYLDLALFYSQQDDGDWPRYQMPVHEVHYGPLARDLSSPRTGTVRIESEGDIWAMRASDQDGDGRAELHVLQSHGGDGDVAWLVGTQKDGGVTLDYNPAEDSDDEADWSESNIGWQDFWQGCQQKL